MRPIDDYDDRMALRVAIDFLRKRAETLGFHSVASLLEQARRSLEDAAAT